MKKIIQIFALFFCILVFAQGEVGALPVVTEDSLDFEQNNIQRERITSFHSDITIAENADVTITETIKVFANGDAIKRGIFRALPIVRNINGRKESVYYKIIAVEKDGVKESYHTKKENGIFIIYIGNKDNQLASGFYTYKIVYQTQDQIGKFKGYDEFYWNVNGTDWSFPVENIQAIIRLPKNADIIQNACYTGVEGSKERNCTSKKISSTQIQFSAENLNQHENLTIAVGFKAGVLKEPSGFYKWINRNWPSFPLIIVSFYLLFFYYNNWRKYGRDPEKPIVIPQFNAPNNLSPASLGYIDTGKFDANLVTANLVDLSIKGFVDIDEVKDIKKSFLSKMFILKKLGSENNSLQNDQKQLLKKLFGKEKEVSVNGTYNSKIKKAVEDFENFIIKENKIFVENISNKKIVYKAIKIMLTTFFLGLIISSLITWSFQTLLIASVIILFASLFATILVLTWEEGNKLIFFVVLMFSMTFILPMFFMAFADSDDITPFESNCFKFLIFGIISILVFRYFINKSGEEKVKMESEIEGFKMYLSAAEENLLQFHNPPEMTSDVYEKFLPYAIVFGVEGIWGKRFRDKLQETIDSAQPYENVQYNFGYSFAGAFTSTLNETTVVPVSSGSSSSSSGSSGSSSYSGGSSSSGSSGGGSSGGGGGGGGGGGW
ncbi:DUF2207 domain-containing protein [Chryseobacterium sp. Ch-15]|uniref:DUF2207 domain-containing protein n=1 Tax=Chryseobacterium muglaense TaxID=2893752 RepID=A0A9Q3UXT5_9FLAO|nr:DUF2207 domain-containing protein [Chryseobacterium muglaense]MBD3903111.1 DUF2207 domain-containing protein [Chryseobacterium muglaense]MCC9035943.1 DUF2207 domain-containing protein [Chryseobacterium muglaense]MCM2553481.1 DUF2207 domain-containing protein [Chryseobacterium muglaense]